MSLLATAAAVLALCVVSPGSASAFGGETLNCRVAPSRDGLITPGSCSAEIPAGGYSIGYGVFGGSGTYTYSWTLPPFQTAAGGCGSTDASCAINVRAITADKSYTVSVQITQGSSTATLSATAEVPATCRLGGMWVDC
jgi:hypothetical protein